MTPHALFGACVVGLSMFLPRVVATFASEGVIFILSFLYPVICTITLLHEYAQDKKEKEESPKSDKENDEPAASSPKRTPQKKETIRNKTPLKEKTVPRHLQPTASSRAKASKSPTGYFPRTKPATDRKKRRQSAGAMLSVVTSVEKSLEEELDYWLRFWMVRSAVLSVKTLFGLFVPLSISIILRNLEFFFYVWLYTLPFFIPQTIGGQALPEARPLRVMVSYLSPAAGYLYDHVANLVPESFWRNTIVATVSRFFDLAVLMRLLSRDFCDWLLHILEESRPLLLPSGTLLMPGMITQYASLYVQYVPMISRSTEGQNSEVCLQYWVLNAMIGSLLQYFSGVLWWIPFSSHATFVLWCYLCLPRTIKSWYGELSDELCSWGLMPGSNQSEDLSKTRLGQTALTVLDILPKAVDEPASPEKKTAGDAPKDVVELTDEQQQDGSDTKSQANKKKGETRPGDSDDDEDDVYIPLPDAVVEQTKATTPSRRSTRLRRRPN